MPLKDDPRNLHIVGSDRIRRPPHRPSPYTCEVRAKDLVSVLDSGRSLRTVRYHAAMYHLRKLRSVRCPSIPCTSQAFCASSTSRLVKLSMFPHTVCTRESAASALNSLRSVRHAFVVVCQDDVTCISAQNERTTMASRVVHDVPQLLKLFQWQDGSHSAFFEPYFLQGPHLSTLAHATRTSIAMAHESTGLLLHVCEEMSVGSAGVACARIDVNMW